MPFKSKRQKGKQIACLVIDFNRGDAKILVNMDFKEIYLNDN